MKELASKTIISTLKRFFAHRGKDSIIFKDNSKDFVSASVWAKTLRKIKPVNLEMQ